MSHPVFAPKKLIEVALPLDAINIACAYEKMPGIGPHPRGIHLWWARRPLAAARAIIFAQLVNDPGYQQGSGFKYGVNKKEATEKRKELFEILNDLVQWKNSTNPEVINRARAEILRSWRETCELNKAHPQAAELFNPDKIPGLHDPFAGGGAIPLEAQRLGLEAFASDLNPVAVLINKAMIEIPPRFAGRQPIGPEAESKKGKKLDLPTSWPGATGLAEDVRRYAAWMRIEAEKRIGHLYQQVRAVRQSDGFYRHATSKEIDNGKSEIEKLTVIAWLWARTVKSPNPVFSHVDVPLASSFILSSKAGKETYVLPVIEGDSYRFEIRSRGSAGFQPASLVAAKNGTKLARGANFCCVISNSSIESKYIYSEAKAGRMGTRLMAIVAEGSKGRIYLSPTEDDELLAAKAEALWKPQLAMPNNPRWFSPPAYGLTDYGDLFTSRQLLALTTFSDLVAEAREKIRRDAVAAYKSNDDSPLRQGGSGPMAYAEAVSVYLAFTVSRCSDFNNSATRWVAGNQKVMNLFGKQAIAMTWDFPEAAILADTVGGFGPAAKYIADCIEKLPSAGAGRGSSQQADAQNQSISAGRFISTDPPYYDNIGYADLSDFFYIWLRKNLQEVFPGGFATIAVPKAEELVATPYRHGSKKKAEDFFLNGMTEAMHRLAELAHPAAPLTIYYAFKQSETKESSTTSTGWVTFLEAVNQSGLQLTGTWPLRSEQEFRMIGIGTNALASSIVLVCRKRAADAPTISRREFQRELNRVLPEALDEMTRGSGSEQSPVAPVDLSQAIIGPGMAIFSRYSAVLEADGTPMSVRTALQLINRFLAEDDFDADTQFCLHWFEQHGWDEGLFGDADMLARAKATSVSGISGAGVIESGGGKVHLLKWANYPADWNPSEDDRKPVWESLHQLIRAFRQEGESGAGKLLAHLKPQAEAIRQLSYRLYTLCERQRWSDDARAYNEIITSWNSIEENSASHTIRDRELFD